MAKCKPRRKSTEEKGDANTMKIKSIIAVIFLLSFLSIDLPAQTTKGGAKPLGEVGTSGPSRYEIVYVRRIIPAVGQTDRAVIKLDTFTGQTYEAIPNAMQLLVDQKYAWLKMTVEGGLPADTSAKGPKYRIYVLEELTYLLNIETGKTWVLPAIIRTWKPFKED